MFCIKGVINRNACLPRVNFVVSAATAVTVIGRLRKRLYEILPVMMIDCSVLLAPRANE